MGGVGREGSARATDSKALEKISKQANMRQATAYKKILAKILDNWHCKKGSNAKFEI